MKATTAIPNPGNMLLNMALLENTGCFLQASRFAQGSRNKGGLGGFAIYRKGCEWVAKDARGKEGHTFVLYGWLASWWTVAERRQGKASHGKL